MARTVHGLPGVFNSSPFTLATGEGSALSVDVNGKLTLGTSTAVIGVVDPSGGAIRLFDGADNVPAEADSSGNLKVTLATLSAGENLTTNRLNNEPIYSYARMTTAATLLVKSGAGTLHSITVNTAVATGTIEFDDALTNTTPIIGNITYPAALLSTGATTSIYDVSFATGLSITTTGTMDITIAYR